MKKLTILALAAMFILPLTAYGQESSNDRDRRDWERKMNQWKRDDIIRDKRRAIEDRDWKETEYQQRRLERQQLQERLLGQ